MPKVKLLTSLAGINFSHNAGDIIDCNEAEAIRFIDAGVAAAIGEPKLERAVKKSATQKAVRKD